jgi:hypothetical protein
VRASTSPLSWQGYPAPYVWLWTQKSWHHAETLLRCCALCGAPICLYNCLDLCLSPPPPFSTQVFFQAADAPTCSQQDCYCLGRRIYNALTDKTNWSWLRGWWGSRQIHSRERITILCRSNAHACTMEQQSELPTMSHKCHPPNRICVVVSESVQYVDLFRLSTGGHSTLSSSPFN